MKMIRITKLRLQSYFSGPAFLVPVISMLVFGAIMYTFKPADFLSSMLVSSVFIFFVSAFVSLSYCGNENEVFEQLMYLYSKDICTYEITKLLFFVAVDFLTTGIMLGIPLIQNAVNGFNFFRFKPTLEDIVCAFVIIFSSSICGGIIGSFFNGRVAENRRTGLLVSIFVLVVCVCKTSLIRNYFWLKFILWIFPPVMISNTIFSEYQHFEFGKTFRIIAVIMIYNLCFFIIKLLLMNHKRVSK